MDPQDKLESTSEEIKIFVEIYQKLYMVAYHVTHNRFLSEEAVQEAFVKVINCRNAKNVHHCETWLKVIVKRTAIDLIRKQNRWNRFTESEECMNECEGCDQASIEKAVERNFQIRDLNNKLRKLDAALREILFLKYVKGHTVKEISEMLNLSVGTVKSRLKSAKEKLKKQISR